MIIALALIGFGDALFLTVKHYQGGPIPCSILNGCDTVTTSIYSEIFSIPISLLGVFFYLAVIILAGLCLDSKKRGPVKWLFGLAAAAFIVSIVLVYLQVFVIEALCLYCLISAALATLIFIFSFSLWKNLWKSTVAE